MVSALGKVRDRLSAYDFGAVDYITKPFDEEELLAKVRAWMSMTYKEEIDEMWTEIETARDAMGMALTKMASFRDTESGDHLVRIRSYSGLLAAQLEIWGPYRREVNETFRKQLFHASPLHDIGKVGIPDAILRKHETLTPSEFEAMKQHGIPLAIRRS